MTSWWDEVYRLEKERQSLVCPKDWHKEIPVRSYKIEIPTSTKLLITLLLASLLFIFCGLREAKAEQLWKITAYCACKKCCGKSDAITASGKKAQYGMVAGNWLSFGTKVDIKGLGIFTVQDRGAKSLFWSKTNHIKHLDVYIPTHKEALKFGVKWLEVTIL